MRARRAGSIRGTSPALAKSGRHHRTPASPGDRMTMHALRRLVPIAAFQWLLVFAAAECAYADAKAEAAPIQQLRIYEIFDSNKQAFHERFRDHAARIMARYDFRIVAMWESRFENRTEFVYLLEWPNEATMKDRWARFMADEEWAAIKKRTGAEHGRLVGAIEDRTLRATDYSSLKTFEDNSRSDAANAAPEKNSLSP